MDETNIKIWILVGLVSVGCGMICFLMNRAINRLDKDREMHSAKLDEHGDLHKECALSLANFKAEVAGNYAKEITMQQSLARIHDRLDHGFEELRGDIKNLMSKK